MLWFTIVHTSHVPSIEWISNVLSMPAKEIPLM